MRITDIASEIDMNMRKKQIVTVKIMNILETFVFVILPKVTDPQGFRELS